MIEPCRRIRFFFPLIVLYVFLILPGCSKSEPGIPEGAVSEFGRYEKYSEAAYKEWVRQSRYVTMRDGVKLAVDIVRPAVNGIPVDEPLPLVWAHHRYHRAVERDGKIYSEVDRNRGLELLIKHGYIVAAADVRGGGASYGRYLGTFSPEETRDAYELTEWFAAQPWCDGNVGMYGASYLGIAQLMAAGEAPPHLKAIFPQVAAFDLFTFVLDGGIYREGFIQLWGDLTRQLDTEIPPVPVDEDPERTMLGEAVRQHGENWDIIHEMKDVQYRDEDIMPDFSGHMPSARVEAINRAGIPIYICGGWYDIYARDPFQMFTNFTVPVKVVMGPWPHGYWNDAVGRERSRVVDTERLRWFDFWLKGINNGIMEEPPINYAVVQAPGETWSWRQAGAWPPEAETVLYYFRGGESGTIDSLNDGILSPAPPGAEEASDAYTTDYGTNTGEQTRWHSGVGVELEYPDMRGNDRRGLTYTTDVLVEDVIVIGHPIVTLYASSSADDADFFLYLEEVDEDGYSHYITEGQIRASCRALGDPPYNNLGLPFHSVSRDAVEKLKPGEPVELILDLLPVANVFDAGNLIRVTLTCADAHVSRTLRLEPPPTVRIHRSRGRLSRIALPVVK